MSEESNGASAEIRFYHLERSSLSQALPALVSKAYQSGKRIVIRTDTVSQREDINQLLWTYQDDSFLPHGSEKDGNADMQPIWVTDKEENPNGAEILILTHGMSQESFDGYSLICEMFDGNNPEMLQAARGHWKAYQERGGASLTYWQQGERGWDKKAEG